MTGELFVYEKNGKFLVCLRSNEKMIKDLDGNLVNQQLFGPFDTEKEAYDVYMILRGSNELEINAN